MMDIQPFLNLISLFRIAFTIFFFIVAFVAAFRSRTFFETIIVALILFFLAAVFSIFIQNILGNEAGVININYIFLALAGGLALGKISKWIMERLFM
ncbi:MAG: hypothetical protein F6K54_40625 [Okeania sp. SIO3B5]|uniref:hypothetical protein n=1 Tax=Okeania sp. SIO3B5 TaxID=2607811 RepID=UPI00140136DA|nr:hypothetical protein [Okeania sp. SIO3B5]NEO58789.1 hypothetical protein [Okeania sp. SIO3B5]